METQNVQAGTETLKTAEETALQRYQWIAPLIEEGLTPSERGELRRKIASKEDISERSLFRYEKLYRDGGFKALFPNLAAKNRTHKNFPDNYDELILKIAALRLENPTRSIERCILILEQEEVAPQGLLKRSTVQCRMQKLGYAHRQIRKQAENKNSSARHQKPHRMMLLQADYSDEPVIPIF